PVPQSSYPAQPHSLLVARVEQAQQLGAPDQADCLSTQTWLASSLSCCPTQKPFYHDGSCVSPIGLKQTSMGASRSAHTLSRAGLLDAFDDVVAVGAGGGVVVGYADFAHFQREADVAESRHHTRPLLLAAGRRHSEVRHAVDARWGVVGVVRYQLVE